MNTRTSKIMIFVFLIFIIFDIQFSFAATYYVANTGSNSNPGTLASPFKSITNGAEKLIAGDILYVRGGVYNEVVTISQNGTASNPITVSGYFDGTRYEVPVIDGGHTLPASSWSGLMNINGSYINVSYFEITNSSLKAYGLFFDAPGQNNKASFMKVHHNGQTGIMGKADYITVEDCEVYLNCMSNSAHLPGAGWGNGIGFAREKSNGIAEYGIIRRCKVYDNHGEGVDAFEASHITIEDCEIFNNFTQNLYVSDASYILVQRNIIYNTSNPLFPPRNGNLTGISLFEERAGLPNNAGFTAPHSTNNTIINNFLYNANISVFTWNESQVKNPGFNNSIIANNTMIDGKLSIGNLVHSDSQIRNNIFYSTGHSVPTKVGITFSNNYWSATPPATAAGTGDIIGNPQVAQTGATGPGALTANFFKLLASSPARDHGVVVPDVTEDYFRTARGSPPDIGGHEYSITVGVSTLDSSSFRLFPNPATKSLTIELSDFQNNIQVQIFNATGRLMKIVNISSTRQNIGIDDLASGIYFVRSSQLPKLSVKFIKQ